MFSLEELTDIVLLYGECNYSARNTRATYADRYPNRRQPNERTIVQLVQRLRNKGTLLPSYEGRGCQRPNRILLDEERILESIENNPGTSTRNISRDTTSSRSTVHRILKQNLLYPYHVQRVQALTEDDFQRRLQFCQWIENKIVNIFDFTKNILFTDECCFTRDGILNFHNTHVWSDENPHAIFENKHQWKFSINTWAGIINNKLIGPFMLPQPLNGEQYLQFLENTLSEVFDDWPLALRTNMWFMHDGAPPHIFLPVRNYLNETFPNRWIGRHGPINWPARSPDLNPLDFFLWGYMKSEVYKTPVNNVQELQNRIMNVGDAVRQNLELLNRVNINFNRRITSCVLSNGRHFEHFL